MGEEEEGVDIDHQEDNVRKYYFANELVLLCVNDKYVCACVCIKCVCM